MLKLNAYIKIYVSWGASTNKSTKLCNKFRWGKMLSSTINASHYVLICLIGRHII